MKNLILLVLVSIFVLGFSALATQPAEDVEDSTQPAEDVEDSTQPAEDVEDSSQPAEDVED